MTASPTGQVSPTVMLVPSVGQAGAGAQGTPLEVVEQPTMVATPLPTMGWMGLPTALMAPTAVGMTQPVVTSPMQTEVASAVTGGS